MRYKAVRGMEDILPEDIKIWQELEKIARGDLESYGYREIRTPVPEDTSIFVRGIGETTDIVTKEMYTFKDRKDRSLTLRPEGTAPIVRAYIEHTLFNDSPELRLYYMGPMFRSERPQKGRSRQFHQIGAEILGSASPYADAELILQLDHMLRGFGLEDFKIKLNSLGCANDKAKFSEKLKEYLQDKKNRLCDDCKKRLKNNVLRVLDCKAEACKQVLRQSPDIRQSLCSPCEDHLSKVKNVLKNIKFVEAKNLVRGLDYYTGTVFEITHPNLGSQDAIGAGGRYDNLVKDLGGPNIPAVGYALGLERIIMALKDKSPVSADTRVVYIATLGDAAKVAGLEKATKIREELKGQLKYFSVVISDIKENASLKAQMRNADKQKAKAVVILGENELKSGKVNVRDMVNKKDYVLDEDKMLDCIKGILEG